MNQCERNEKNSKKLMHEKVNWRLQLFVVTSERGKERTKTAKATVKGPVLIKSISNALNCRALFIGPKRKLFSLNIYILFAPFRNF